jgi:CBS domain-containing protein
MRLSQLVGSALVDQHGRTVGRVVDLVARFADEGYPPITGLLARVEDDERFVPARRLASLGEGQAVVAGDRDAASLGAFERRAGEVLLCRDVQGRKLIYLAQHHRGRLVRAEDIFVGPQAALGEPHASGGGDPAADQAWSVVGIDVGRRRRWPWGRRVERTVDWRDVEPFLSHVPTSRLRLRARRLGQLHPSDVADLVEEASPAEADEIIQAVGEDREFEADVFEELDEEHQLDLVARRTDGEVAALLATMAADDAVDLLAEMDRDRREPVLALMPAPAANRLRALLRYNPQSAGGLMSPGALCLSAATTVGDALRRLATETGVPDTLDTVFVVDDEGRLAAAARIRELLRADADRTMGEVAHPDPPCVHTSADLVEVTLVMTDYNLVSLAVVDEQGHVVGVVTIDDVVEQLVPENWRRRAEADTG